MIFQLKCNRKIGAEALEKYKGIQLVDPTNVASQDHLEFAITQAKKAFERGENLSNNLFVEILLRASAQRQIKVAFDMMGLKESSTVVAIAEKLPTDFMSEYGCSIDPNVLTMDEQKYENLKKNFEINEDEIRSISNSEFEERSNALVKIIMERIALIPTL